jgi:hypothetical protein
VIYLVVLAARSPDRLRATGRVFGEEPAAPAEEVTPV